MYYLYIYMHMYIYIKQAWRFSSASTSLIWEVLCCILLPQAYAGKEMEEQLRSVSSVDELMTVLYPEYWKMYKCQLRKGGWQHSKEQANTNTRTGETLKFAAAHYNTEILRSKYGKRKYIISFICQPSANCHSDPLISAFVILLNTFKAKSKTESKELFSKYRILRFHCEWLKWFLEK